MKVAVSQLQSKAFSSGQNEYTQNEKMGVQYIYHCCCFPPFHSSFSEEVALHLSLRNTWVIFF